MVRHRAEHYQPEELKALIEDIVFDVGKRFSSNGGDDGRDNREARLRQELRARPEECGRPRLTSDSC